MNKFAIPTILLATVMVAGMFAFAPVDQASTVHSTVGSTAILFELEKTLPSNDDDVSWTLDCGDGVMVTAIFVDNTATPDDNESQFNWIDITLGGTSLEWASDAGTIGTIGQFDIEEWRDLIRVAEQKEDGSAFGPITCTADDDLVLTFDADGQVDTTVLNMIIVVQGNTSGVSLE